MLDLQWDFDEAKHAWFQQGEKSGGEKKLLENLRSVMSKLNTNADGAMDFLDVPQNERNYYISKLNESAR